MNYRLSKVKDQQFYDEAVFSSRYDVYDGSQLTGQFFYSRKRAYFTYDRIEIELQRKPSLFSPDKVRIIQDGKEIGRYKLTNWLAFRGYADSILIQDEHYQFKRVTPDVKFRFYKKATWGHFKFTLCNNAEEIIYSFRIDYPAVSAGNTSAQKPFEGSITCSTPNKLLVMAGLFLVERALENDSID